jgi:hypothetical protein
MPGRAATAPAQAASWQVSRHGGRDVQRKTRSTVLQYHCPEEDPQYESTMVLRVFLWTSGREVAAEGRAEGPLLERARPTQAASEDHEA